MSDPVLKYCVSWITNYICQDATQHLLIQSWNHHKIPDPMGCIPVENMRLSQQNARLNEVFVPSTSKAGGNLSRNSYFCSDPLVMNEEAYEYRLRSFLVNQPTGEAIFADLAQGYNESLKISIEYFYNLTTSL